MKKVSIRFKERFLFFITTIILLFSHEVKLFSATVSINDTTLNRGTISEIFIYADFSNETAESVEIEIEFNALNLDIKTVAGADDYIMSCDKPLFDVFFGNFRNAVLTIDCDNIDKKSGILCKLIVEPLSGPDSVTLMTPKELKIDGQIQSDAELIEAILRIPGESIFQMYPEGLGQNYPNPFYEETRFPMSINHETNVSFMIYTNDGRFVLSNEQLNDMLELSFYDNYDELVPITSLHNKLKRGNYVLKLKPDFMQFASGEYYLIMITDENVYHKNFIYLK